MSSKTRNPLLTFLLSYHVWVTSKIQVNFRFERYWWYCLINFWNFQTIHVFEVRESIADISTELPCLSYLENLGQLPVHGYLKGTDNCILWIFTISSLFMFSRSRNPLLTFLLSYDVWSHLDNPSQLPVWEVLMILSYEFLKFSHYSCFRDQGIHCWYFYRATMFGYSRKSR